MSITEVASASGFSSASVFTRNFKQRYTMTPTEFRKKEK
jgi:AraC-like DNA-binding protein